MQEEQAPYGKKNNNGPLLQGQRTLLDEYLDRLPEKYYIEALAQLGITLDPLPPEDLDFDTDLNKKIWFMQLTN